MNRRMLLPMLLLVPSLGYADLMVAGTVGNDDIEVEWNFTEDAHSSGYTSAEVTLRNVGTESYTFTKLTNWGPVTINAPSGLLVTSIPALSLIIIESLIGPGDSVTIGLTCGWPERMRLAPGSLTYEPTSSDGILRDLTSLQLIPEPGTALLCAFGAVALVMVRRRR